MSTLRTNALTALANTVTAFTAYANAIDARQIIFDPLQTFATRIINALKASGASDAVIKDALTINRKIQGKRAKPIKEVENTQTQKAVDPKIPIDPNVPVNISVSQLSFDSMVEHYSKLIALLTTVTVYNPNEPELKIAGLNTLHANMKASNNSAITATTNFINARIARNNLLYAKVTGMLTVAQECKSYVKSVYGATSAQYKAVSGIKFTNRKI
jgi:hypothetical protein